MHISVKFLKRMAGKPTNFLVIEKNIFILNSWYNLMASWIFKVLHFECWWNWLLRHNFRAVRRISSQCMPGKRTMVTTTCGVSSHQKSSKSGYTAENKILYLIKRNVFFPLCISWQRSSINDQLVASWHEVHHSLACFVIPDLDSNLSPLSWEDAGWTWRKEEASLPTSSMLNFFLLQCSCHGPLSGTQPPASFVASLSLKFPAPHSFHLWTSSGTRNLGNFSSRRPIHMLSRVLKPPLGKGSPFQIYSFFEVSPSALVQFGVLSHPLLVISITSY